MSGIREYYEINEKDGIVLNKKLGNRAFVLGLEPWASLVERLSHKYGSGAEVILFDIGKSYGLSVAQEEKRTDLDQELTINFLARMATIAGWGRVMISRDSHEEMTVKVQKCVFCAGTKDYRERQVPCFFLKGVISGFAEVLFKSTMEIDETHCASDYCEFAVKFVR